MANKKVAATDDTDAAALIEQIKQQSTLDELLARDPKPLTDADVDKFIVIERDQRARFISVDAEKKGGKVPSQERRPTTLKETGHEG